MRSLFVACALLWSQMSFSVLAQEAEPATREAADAAQDSPTVAPPTSSPAVTTPTASAEAKVKEIAERVNQDKNAQEASAGILKQIYVLAEKMESPFFHWVAFALMVTGVVSYALQLVLGKLLVLVRMSLSPSEILSDALGLLMSLVGLVLTTQAAAQNSTFTQNPAAVLSATGVGAVLGFLFFRWGTKQEISAADGRKEQSKTESSKKS